MATLSRIIAWKINPMDRGPWWATVYEVADVHVHMHMCARTHTHTHTELIYNVMLVSGVL